MSTEQTAESTETTEVVETTEITPESAEQAPADGVTEMTLADVYSKSDEEITEFLHTMESAPIEDEQGNIIDENQEVALVSEETPEEEEGVTPEGETNYQALVEELFKPFKAGGQQIQVDSIEEAKRLMEQGVGFHKNMQKMKPHKQIINLLEKRGGLDAEKLDFLLDVAEGKPEAVAKLLKEQNVDPYDINIDVADNYESEYEDNEPVTALNDVFESLDGDGKVKTLELLSSDGWDDKSRAILYNDHTAIRTLNTQMNDGTFDIVMSEVVKKQSLGQLLDMTDLEAYNQVGNELAKQGKFGIPNKPSESTTSNSPASKAKRKAAASAPRQAPSNVPKQEAFNPATASIEEVEKFVNNQLSGTG